MFDNDIRIKTNTSINDNNISKQKPKIEQVLPFDIIDPKRVTRPAGRDGNNNNAQNGLAYNSDSVFEKFIQALNNTPELSEGCKKLILNKQFINYNIKNDPVLNTLFESFLKSIEMNEKEILNFLKFQQNTYTKFHGDFFTALRSLLKGNSNNDDYKIVLRNFLKSYDCFVSLNDTFNSISSTLKSIKDIMPDVLKKPFEELVEKLITENLSNSTDINLNILKNDILPFIGRYISKMNDFGPIRDYVSVLIHNIVRLDAGSKENFSTNLDNLFDFLKFNLNLRDDEIEKIKISLLDNYENTANIKNDSIDSFLKLIESGIKNSENIVNKGVMEDMTESLLFSQNVHIPLLHMFLPLNYNGMFMFSELWVGKKTEEASERKNKLQQSVDIYKVFITFDIQNIGYFETVLVSKDSKLSLELSVPSSFKSYFKKIKDDIGAILNNKNIAVSNIYINECIKKRKFNEVFNTIAERKDGVNVII